MASDDCSRLKQNKGKVLLEMNIEFPHPAKKSKVPACQSPEEPVVLEDSGKQCWKGPQLSIKQKGRKLVEFSRSISPL